MVHGAISVLFGGPAGAPRLALAAGLSVLVHLILLWPGPSRVPRLGPVNVIRAELRSMAQGERPRAAVSRQDGAIGRGSIPGSMPVGGGAGVKGSAPRLRQEASRETGVATVRPAVPLAPSASLSRQTELEASGQRVSPDALVDFRLRLARALRALPGEGAPPSVSSLVTVELRVHILPGGRPLVAVANDGSAPAVAAWAKARVAEAAAGQGLSEWVGLAVDLAVSIEPGGLPGPAP
ncbi:MAG: hypothetical protein RBS40_01985 [Rhodocyclaceae bacterium]|nr:hypothetical protein [Rhodocyclaceae bacterium]